MPVSLQQFRYQQCSGNPSLLSLQQIFVNILIVPNVIIPSFSYSSTSLTNSPQCLRNWCRIVEVNFWELFFDGISGNLSLVVGNGRIKVVRDMGRANFVMEEVNKTPRVEFVVRTINCMECASNKVVVIVSKMWNINVSMLKPRCSSEGEASW